MAAISQNSRTYPFGAADRLNVDPRLIEACATDPVLRVRLPYGGDAWLVTRYAEIKTVLSDPRFSRAAAAGKDVPRRNAAVQPPSSLLGMDPPEHTRLRRLAAKAFTVRRIEMLRPRAQEIVDGLLDRMIVAGPPADLAEALSWPLPITIVCDLLGVPFADRDRFRAWTDGILVLSGPPEAPARAIAHLEDYILGLIVQRRAAEPVDDLLGDLIAARDEEDRLSEQELVTFASDLLFAGHETTANQIGNFVYTLLTNPSRWQELLADPDLVPAAVEELSRITPLGASSGSTHIAAEDLELGGRSIKAGDALIVEVAAAHRDPGLLDHPNEIDFHRGDFSHLAYGHGAHRCIGAQLARVELQVAIATLVRRLPSLRLAVPTEQICWRQDHLFRGVVSLPVTWQVNG